VKDVKSNTITTITITDDRQLENTEDDSCALWAAQTVTFFHTENWSPDCTVDAEHEPLSWAHLLPAHH